MEEVREVAETGVETWRWWQCGDGGKGDGDGSGGKGCGDGGG